MDIIYYGMIKEDHCEIIYVEILDLVDHED